MIFKKTHEFIFKGGKKRMLQFIVILCTDQQN